MPRMLAWPSFMPSTYRGRTRFTPPRASFTARCTVSFRPPPFTSGAGAGTEPSADTLAAESAEALSRALRMDAFTPWAKPWPKYPPSSNVTFECDWLSVAVGSVHGAIADNLLDQKKPAAKLDVEHIQTLRDALNIPLVLHGGSGIEHDYIVGGIKAGIAKINVGTELRQPYERAMREKNDVEYAREVVYKRCRELIRDFLHTADDAKILF